MQIERKKVSELVYEKLVEKIRNGDYPPKTKLPSESELVQLFGVSRTPIREALSVLAAGGLIESKQGGRSWVKEVNFAEMLESVQFEMITAEEVCDLLEMRTIIEAEAAALAAVRHTEKDIKRLNESLEAFSMTVKDDQIIGFEADYNFHATLVKAAYNPFLTQTIENLSDLHIKALRFSLSQNLGWERKRKEVFIEHERIYEAIKARNSEAARAAVIDHLTNARKKLNDERIFSVGSNHPSTNGESLIKKQTQ